MLQIYIGWCGTEQQKAMACDAVLSNTDSTEWLCGSMELVLAEVHCRLAGWGT